MDPIIGGAIVSGVASLLGGRKAAKEQRRAIAEQNAYNHPSAIRARAEEAGFNPLLFIGPGVGQQMTVAQPVMGQAIANAGLAMAQGISQHAETQAYAEKLEQQNAELRKALDSATLRPDVPGPVPARASTGAPVAAGILKAGNVSVPAVPPAASKGIIAPMGAHLEEKGGAYPDWTDPTKVPPTVQPLWNAYMGPNGDLLWAPEGPDADELLTGAALSVVLQKQGADRVLATTDKELRRFNPFHRDGYYQPTRFSGG